MTSNTFLSPAHTFTASAGDFVYLWGGRGNVENDAFIYRHSSGEWKKQLTKGQHPPSGLSNGGCVMSGHNLYLYGGYDNAKCNSGDLYELNTQTWQWKKLSDGSAGGPGKKHGCGMISYQDQLLVVSGAYDKMPASKQPGAEYQTSGILVCTNEVHYYGLPTGPWRSPSKREFQPPPCYNFSLTRIDENRAMMFGGKTPKGSSSSDLYVLDMSDETWIQCKEGDPWPGARLGHIAACLDYQGQNPRLLISGGSDGNHIYHDIWLLDLQSKRMKEVRVPDKQKKLIEKRGHGAVAVTVNSCEEVILFGRNKRCDALVLRFEFRNDQWSLADIDDKSHLGSPVRRATKRKMIQSSSPKDNERKLQKQEGDASRRAGVLQESLVETVLGARGKNRREEMIELVELRPTLKEKSTPQEETD